MALRRRTSRTSADAEESQTKSLLAFRKGRGNDAKVGLWADLSSEMEDVPSRNRRVFYFTPEELQAMTDGRQKWGDTGTCAQAFAFAHNVPVTPSPSKGENGGARSKGEVVQAKNNSSRQKYATDWSLHDGRGDEAACNSKNRGKKKKKENTCWVILDFGTSKREELPTHRIFTSWHDVGTSKGAQSYIDGFSSVQHRRFTSTQKTTCFEFAERLLAEKGIHDMYYDPAQSADATNNNLGLTGEAAPTEGMENESSESGSENESSDGEGSGGSQPTITMPEMHPAASIQNARQMMQEAGLSNLGQDNMTYILEASSQHCRRVVGAAPIPERGDVWLGLGGRKEEKSLPEALPYKPLPPSSQYRLGPDSYRDQVPQVQPGPATVATKEGIVKMSGGGAPADGQARAEAAVKLEDDISAMARVQLGRESCSKCLLPITATEGMYAIACSGDRCLFHPPCAAQHLQEAGQITTACLCPSGASTINYSQITMAERAQSAAESRKAQEEATAALKKMQEEMATQMRLMKKLMGPQEMEQEVFVLAIDHLSSPEDDKTRNLVAGQFVDNYIKGPGGLLSHTNTVRFLTGLGVTQEQMNNAIAFQWLAKAPSGPSSLKRRLYIAVNNVQIAMFMLSAFAPRPGEKGVGINSVTPSKTTQYNTFKIKIATDPLTWDQPEVLVEVDKEEKKIKYVPSCSSQLLESSLKQLNVTGYNEKLWNPLFKPPEAAFTSDKAPEAEIEMDRRDSGAGSNSPAGARSSFSGQANSDRQRDGGSGTKRYREYEDTRPGRQRGRGGHY